MKVLVCYATKMGSTKEIAEAIATRLRTHALDVTVADAAHVPDVGGFENLVIGSAVYSLRWRPEAMALLTRVAKSSTAQRVWLFQSGPFEREIDQNSARSPKRVAQLAAQVGADRPMTFGGRIEAATAQGFIARRMAAGSTAGDYRDFAAIRRWADEIAHELVASITSAVHSDL